MRKFSILIGLLFFSFPVQAHDWLTKLRNGENIPCCGANDCFPLKPNELIFSDDGYYFVIVGGQGFPISRNAILFDQSEDGNNWICPTYDRHRTKIERIRCLITIPGM